MKTVVKFNLRPMVPPPEKANMEIQTDFSFLSDEPGCSSKEEVPTSSGGSQKREEPEEKKYNLKADDTAPAQKPTTLLYNGQGITGNEDDSIF